MYGDPSSLEHWLKELAPTAYCVGLCVQAPLLPFGINHHHPFVKIGSQDCHHLDEGPFTGWISPKLLALLGAHYVILGHSERRFFEDDQMIHDKAKAALRHGLTPIICIGESLDIREKGDHLSFVSNQLQIIFNNIEGHCIIAYEPRFAIGTGRIPSIHDIEEMHTHIRKTLHSLKFETSLPLLYGGSVKPENASALLKIDNVDGLLVGGASLQIEEFNAIIAG